MEKLKINYLKIILPEFLTHINQSKNTFVKVGYNRIYAGTNHFIRAKMVSQLHSFIDKAVPKNVTLNYPVAIKLTITCPINWSSVRMYKKQVSWKKPDSKYKPNWDLDNLVNIWSKCINDVLIQNGILPDDTVEFITELNFKYIPCEELIDRNIIIELRSIVD